ncbi:MAG: hypothetical protein V7K40_10815 [Nostoc sp.]|uniref:hypothetical protein n=1 Tax=Nostoc sp. TaxID=1180 RepID=UPI002FF50E36
MHLWELGDAINRLCTGIGSRDAINRLCTGHLICYCCEQRYTNQVRKEQLSQLRSQPTFSGFSPPAKNWCLD